MSRKERPILFNGEMVRAILEGRKTQTRRVVKPQPPARCRYSMNGNGDKALCLSGSGPNMLHVPPRATSADTFLRCPYGVPGDRLWVRETWGVGCRPDPIEGWRDGVEYRADEHGLAEPELLPLYPVSEDVDLESIKAGWHPSIHMPRWASRILLEVTDVRVERVQDISEEDALAEGVTSLGDGVGKVKFPGRVSYGTTRGCFSRLWNSINAKGGFGWDANPWVWVVEFKRVLP